MRTHDVDPFSLVFGAIFALGGLAFLVLKLDVSNLHLDRVWPVVVMGLGLLIVGLSVRGSRRRGELEPHPEPEAPQDD